MAELTSVQGSPAQKSPMQAPESQISFDETLPGADAAFEDTASVGMPPPTRAMRLWQMAFVAILVAFMGILAFRLWDTNVSEQRADGLAPEFTFTTFEGETISLSDLQGKGVVLNFWASWCDPCRDEAALLESAWRREQENGIVFIGLDYLDQEPAARAYLEEYEISYPNGPDLQSAAARRYGIKGVPETYFIAPDGTIVQTVIGPITNPAQLDTFLARIRP